MPDVLNNNGHCIVIAAIKKDVLSFLSHMSLKKTFLINKNRPSFLVSLCLK